MLRYFMENIPSKVVDSINLGRQISEGARKLERVIVLRPAGTTNDIIGIVSYAKQHGDLKGYDVNRIEQVMEKERKANRVLSDAFKRITLFEAASYIEGTFASELGDDDVAREKVPEILRAQISLMDRSDYSEAYETITQAYRTLLGQRGSHLKVSGKVNGTYLFNFPLTFK